jgi:short-subunit dehydrogenase
LCPGAIRTPALEWGKYHETLEDLGAETQRRIIERLRPMAAAAFARAALKAISRNKAIIIIPARWKAIWWINRISPGLALILAHKTFEQRKKAFAGDSNRPEAAGSDRARPDPS